MKNETWDFILQRLKYNVDKNKSTWTAFGTDFICHFEGTDSHFLLRDNEIIFLNENGYMSICDDEDRKITIKRLYEQVEDFLEKKNDAAAYRLVGSLYI